MNLNHSEASLSAHRSRTFVNNSSDSRIQRVLARTGTDLSQNNLCSVCYSHFSFGMKKYVCSICSMPVCKAHSGGRVAKNQARVCDTCRKDDIKQQTYLFNNPSRQAISEEYKRALAEKESRSKLIRQQDGELANLESQLEFKRKKYADSIASLSQKLNIERERNAIEAQKLEKLKALVAKNNEIEEQQQTLWQTTRTDLEQVKAEHARLQEFVDADEQEYQQVRDFIEGKIEFAVLQKNLCHQCNKKIRYLIKTAQQSGQSGSEMQNKPCCFVF